MAIMSGFDTETMERVFDPNDKESQVAFWEDVRNTSTWQRFKSEFGFTAENQARLDDVLTKLHGDAEFFTLSAFIGAVNVAMNAGEVVRKPVAPVVEQATIPVDKNGGHLVPRKFNGVSLQTGLKRRPQPRSKRDAELKRCTPGLIPPVSRKK